MASFDEVIPPGQAGKVTAALRTDGLTGTVTKAIAVTLDDPARPALTLTLRATVVASVDLIPMRQMVLTTARKEGAVGRLLVRKTATEQGSLVVSDLKSSQEWLEVSARKIEAAEPAGPGLPAALPSDWVIEARVEREPPAGGNTAQVRFKTGLTREPEVEFPVSVRVPPPLSFSVPMLDLPPPVDPSQPARGVVYVQVGRGLDDAGLSVESLSPSFRIGVEKVDEGRFKVDVSWMPVEGDPSRDGALVAKLGSLSTSMAVRVRALSPPPAPPPIASPDGPRKLQPLSPAR